MNDKNQTNKIQNMRWSEILQRFVEDQNGTPMRWSEILQRWVEA